MKTAKEIVESNQELYKLYLNNEDFFGMIHLLDSEVDMEIMVRAISNLCKKGDSNEV